jgi:hypothetical protein
MSYTTIQINVHTRAELNKLRNALNQTYDQVLLTLLDIVPQGDDEGRYTDEFKASLIRGMADIKHGRTSSMSEIKDKLGIK